MAFPAVFPRTTATGNIGQWPSPREEPWREGRLATVQTPARFPGSGSPVRAGGSTLLSASNWLPEIDRMEADSGIPGVPVTVETTFEVHGFPCRCLHRFVLGCTAIGHSLRLSQALERRVGHGRRFGGCRRPLSTVRQACGDSSDGVRGSAGRRGCRVDRAARQVAVAGQRGRFGRSGFGRAGEQNGARHVKAGADRAQGTETVGNLLVGRQSAIRPVPYEHHARAVTIHDGNGCNRSRSRRSARRSGLNGENDERRQQIEQKNGEREPSRPAAPSRCPAHPDPVCRQLFVHDKKIILSTHKIQFNGC